MSGPKEGLRGRTPEGEGGSEKPSCFGLVAHFALQAVIGISCNLVAVSGGTTF